MEECYYLKEKLIVLFPSFVFPVANNSFLIKSNLKCSDILINEMPNDISRIGSGDKIIRQIYVAEINNLKFYTHGTKKIEIEYLTNAICNINQN
jgi:hypothetical protein